jgi:predicted RNA-binding Zn-ribbon protein involved in translation (DUF1610 family)
MSSHESSLHVTAARLVCANCAQATLEPVGSTMRCPACGDELGDWRCTARARNVIPAPRCELERGHAGAHQADRIWWLR